MIHKWTALLLSPVLLASCSFGCGPTASEPEQVTVADIVREYEVAGDAADIIFSGRRLTFRGAVGRTGESRRGTPFIEFSSGSLSVLATFPLHYASAVAAIQPGTMVTLECQSAGTGRSVRMRDCRIAG